RAHPGITSRSVTHPEIAPGQARLTSEFFGDRLPEKKLQLVGMSILLIILSTGPGCHKHKDLHPCHAIGNPRRHCLDRHVLGILCPAQVTFTVTHASRSNSSKDSTVYLHLSIFANTSQRRTKVKFESIFIDL